MSFDVRLFYSWVNEISVRFFIWFWKASHFLHDALFFWYWVLLLMRILSDEFIKQWFLFLMRLIMLGRCEVFTIILILNKLRSFFQRHKLAIDDLIFLMMMLSEISFFVLSVIVMNSRLEIWNGWIQLDVVGWVLVWFVIGKMRRNCCLLVFNPMSRVINSEQVLNKDRAVNSKFELINTSLMTF